MKNLIVLSLLMLLGACSSNPYRVVESMDGNNKPNWATMSKTTWKKDGKVYAVGIAEGLEPDRVTSLMRIADNNAKSEVTRLIANEIGVDFKNVEAGLRGEGSYSYSGSEKSTVSIQELGLEERYFEKIQLKDDENAPVKIYFYSLVVIPENTYSRFIKEAREQVKTAAVIPTQE